MFRNSVIFVALFVSFYSATQAQQFQWPSNLPKCKPGDEPCIAKTLTHLFRHSDEMKSLNLPNLDPFVWAKMTEVRTHGANAAVNVVIKNSNTRITGLKSMEIKEVKGFGIDPRSSKFEIRSFIPTLNTVSDYESTMNLFSLPIKTEGVSNTTIQNMELKQHIDSEVITKNGKDYLHVKSVRVHMKLAKLQINFDSRTGSKEVNDEINKVVNQQWRDIYKEIKPDLEQNVAEVIKSIIGPLFDNIPYQDFFL